MNDPINPAHYQGDYVSISTSTAERSSNTCFAQETNQERQNCKTYGKLCGISPARSKGSNAMLQPKFEVDDVVELAQPSQGKVVAIHIGKTEVNYTVVWLDGTVYTVAEDLIRKVKQ